MSINAYVLWIFLTKDVPENIIHPKGSDTMYDSCINDSKFREIRSLIHDYTDYGKDYNGLSIEEIGDRAYDYYEAGLLSSSRYDYVSSLIDDLE